MAVTKVLTVFKTLIRQIKLILFTLIFVITIPCFVILFTPIYIFRYMVSKAKCLGPKLGNIVDARSAVFALDSPYHNPTLNVLACSVIKGDSSDMVQFLRERIWEKVIAARRENGELTYPEVQQYPYTWMGFHFWKWDDSFAISNHIKFYSSPETDGHSKISMAKLRKIEQSFIRKPFEKNRSPWEFLVVRNVESDSGELESVLICRFHHILADGFSAMKVVFAALIDNGTTSFDEFITKQNKVKRNVLYRFFSSFINLLLAPYEYTKDRVEAIDHNEWIPTKMNENDRKLICGVSKNISISELKATGKKHNVSMTSVLLAGLTGALRRTMLRKGGKVPKSIHLVAPVPLPGHPDKLTNHMAIVYLELPVGETDPVKRLKTIQKNVIDMKDSLIPAMTFYLILIFGAIFPCVSKYFIISIPVTTIFSSFPGPKQKLFINGQEIIGTYFHTGPTAAFPPFANFTLTHGDLMSFTFTSNNHLIKDEKEVEDIIKYIEEEYYVA